MDYKTTIETSLQCTMCSLLVGVSTGGVPRPQPFRVLTSSPVLSRRPRAAPWQVFAVEMMMTRARQGRERQSSSQDVHDGPYLTGRGEGWHICWPECTSVARFWKPPCRKKKMQLRCRKEKMQRRLRPAAGARQLGKLCHRMTWPHRSTRTCRSHFNRRIFIRVGTLVVCGGI